jgi:hypothetical protein
MGSRAIWLKEVKQLRKSVREIFCCAEQKHFLHLWACMIQKPTYPNRKRQMRHRSFPRRRRPHLRRQDPPQRGPRRPSQLPALGKALAHEVHV